MLTAHGYVIWAGVTALVVLLAGLDVRLRREKPGSLRQPRSTRGRD